ncbi:MAG: TonB family protein [Byssovorax sp.]
MSEPRRILDESAGKDGDPSAALRRSLLRAARDEVSPPAAQRDLLAALGLGDSAVSARPAEARSRREPTALRWTPPALFSSVLRGETLDPRRYGAGALFSVMAHAAVVALALHGLSGATAPRPGEPQAMVQLSARPVAVLPPGMATAPLGEPSPARDPAAIMAPPERGDRVAARAIEGSRAGSPWVRVSSPDELAAGADSRSPAAHSTSEARIAGPSAISPPAGVAAPLPSSEILPFGDGMNLPRLIEGPEPVYPRAAREARVQGTLLAKCVITTQGALQGCKILKSLPFLDEPVLTALAGRRYAPVMFQGRPINVEYVISLRFELP